MAVEVVGWMVFDTKKTAAKGEGGGGRSGSW
jgi:hypothetical protein